MTDYSEALSTPEPIAPPIPHNAIRIASHDEQKPLLKMIKRMLQPKHKQTKRFVKPRQQRKAKAKQFY